MNASAKRALFGVSVVLGIMLGLEAHIDRSTSAQGYTSYLEASNQLTTALSQTPALRLQLTRAQSLYSALQGASEHADSGLALVNAEMAKLDAAAGLTPLRGSGVIIRINYDPNLPVIAGLRYVDEATQLQMLVNYLLASGAQAISINGQRLITTSSIRSVNGLNEVQGPFSGTLQVNAVPVQAPYVVSVIGSVEAIRNMLEVEDLADQFTLLDQSFVVQSYTRRNSMTLPAYTGDLPGQYATEGGD